MGKPEAVQKPSKIIVNFNLPEKKNDAPKGSISFHSFTHENQTWEEHLLKTLSESTSKWLVLEKTADPVQKQKLAKLMNFEIVNRETQLIEENEPNEEMIALEKSEVERRQ